MRAAVILLASVAFGAASLAGARSKDGAAGAACSFPEVVRAWSRAPVSLATLAERRESDLAGHVDQPYRIRLAPCTASWCKAGGHAAMAKIEVPRAGRWRVGLDTRLWIDVWTADRKLEGVLCEHHGCEPLRKIVQYDLSPGPHWVVVEGNGPTETGLLLTRVNE